MTNLTNEQEARLRSAIKGLTFRSDQGAPIGGHLHNFVQIVDFLKLAAPNAQIIFGRNGTGKTHLFHAFEEYCRATYTANRKVPVYLDCRGLDIRSLGAEISLERLLIIFYKRIIKRVVSELQEFSTAVVDVSLLQQIFGGEAASRRDNILRSTQALDTMLNEGIIEESVRSYIRRIETEAEGSSRIEGAVGLSAEASPDDVGGKIKLKAEASAEADRKHKRKIETVYNGLAVIDYDAICSHLESIVKNIGAKSIIILIDEWSDLPIEIQPLIAEMLRKTLGTSQSIHFKIGALRFYCATSSSLPNAQRIGLKRGIDISVLEDLDTLLCFEAQGQAVKDFLTLVLYKHVVSADASLSKLTAVDFESAVCDTIFESEAAYKNLVRASEGNPRDFLRLLVSCCASVEIDAGRRISDRAVLTAAIGHFQNDKLPEVANSPEANRIFERLFQLVVQKKSKLFLISSSVAKQSHALMELWNFRFVHLVMENLPTIHDDVAVDYDVYSLDYGKLLSIKLIKGGEERLDQIELAAEVIGPGLSLITALPLTKILLAIIKNETVSGALRKMFGTRAVQVGGIEAGSFDKLDELIESGCIADSILTDSQVAPAAGSQNREKSKEGALAVRKGRNRRGAEG